MDFKELPSQYDHAAAQAKWYPEWERRGYFHAEVGAKDADGKLKPPFTIVIPPPNVTGALHIGHALNNTLQDILIRQKRMQGFNTLWMPGTDHAGIATQAVVERRLFEEEKKTRHDLGREGLVDRIWKWKEQYEARILGQLKAMGCSCDWARTRFTLDDQCARAVREWFFRLFKDGKIYRGKRLVNWDTFLQTAVSDDEVFHEATKGSFWHFKYPVVAADLKPGEPEFVTIATTRPETMLGDTAVAVHPDPAKALDRAEDEAREKKDMSRIMELRLRREVMLAQLQQLRDMSMRGVMLELPLTGEFDSRTGKWIPGTGRRIPLILDEWAKPELGSGCVKITPAHDSNDYEVWQRNRAIGSINIMTVEGLLNDNVPEKYRGLKMHTKAREAVVADMEAAGFFNPETDREDREIDLAHSDRSKTPIEPYLADQWFMDMHSRFKDGRPCLADMAMNAVTNLNVTIVPDRYAKGYLDWLGEKRDWPIGRQLWWGHRVPVWKYDMSTAGSAALMRGHRGMPERDATALKLFMSLPDLYPNSVSRPPDWMRSGDALGPNAPRTPLSKSVDETQIVVELEPIRIESTYRLCLADDAHVAALEQAGYVREDDVLDTWFSSALWPHSTLGWPDTTPELKTFYPTSTLITSRDIITLWVARMVLAGLYNMGEVPFHEVYITPKILDGYGETMSKSKGNGVDPIDVIEKFGADALRFGLAYLTTDTQDVKLPVDFECPHCGAQFAQTKKNRQLPRIECEKCKQPFCTQWAEKPEDKALARGAVVSERFELGRNFCNKLWNASRFSLINLEGYATATGGRGFVEEDLLVEDRWLLSRLSTVTEQVTEFLAKYRYAEAARTLYDFAWNEFCSFYVEMSKARFAVAEQRVTAQRVLAHALDTLLRLLHPMIPFLTEEVWQLLAQVAPVRGIAKPQAAEESVCVAAWPIADKARQDATIEAQFADFQAVLGAVREIRKSQNIPFSETLEFAVRSDAATAGRLEPMQPYFTQMARATGTAWGPKAAAPDVAASVTLSGQSGPLEVHVDVSRFIDVEAEQKRLEKELENLTKFIKSIDGKLSNAAFVDKAPAEVVQQQREKRAELVGQLASVEAALAKLK